MFVTVAMGMEYSNTSTECGKDPGGSSITHQSARFSEGCNMWVCHFYAAAAGDTKVAEGGVFYEAVLLFFQWKPRA